MEKCKKYAKYEENFKKCSKITQSIHGHHEQKGYFPEVEQIYVVYYSSFIWIIFIFS